MAEYPENHAVEVLRRAIRQHGDPAGFVSDAAEKLIDMWERLSAQVEQAAQEKGPAFHTSAPAIADKPIRETVLNVCQAMHIQYCELPPGHSTTHSFEVETAATPDPDPEFKTPEKVATVTCKRCETIGNMFEPPKRKVTADEVVDFILDREREVERAAAGGR